MRNVVKAGIRVCFSFVQGLDCRVYQVVGRQDIEPSNKRVSHDTIMYPLKIRGYADV